MVLNLELLDLGTSEGGTENRKYLDRDQLHRLAAHDERARKNGYERKMRRIELVKMSACILRWS